MESHNDWQQIGPGNEEFCQREYQTLEVLSRFETVLRAIVLQKHDSLQLDYLKPAEERSEQSRVLIVTKSQAFCALRARIGELEDGLSEGYNTTELGEYGTIKQHLGRHSFRMGFLDQYRSVPLLRRSPPGVIHFLEKLPDFKEY